MIISGCSNATEPPNLIKTNILVDGSQIGVEIPIGGTVQTALIKASISLKTLDRVEPPSFTLLIAPTTIRVTRVREDFEVEEKVILFEKQTVFNESLPEGQKILIQPGMNGLQQITYRIIYEDNTETSRSISKIINITEAKSEIEMVGVQSPFTPQPIPGKLVYLTNTGNAWLMEKNTGNRRPLITTGDLDGQIFALSPDENWLLFSRKLSKPTPDINSLWVININNKNFKELNLQVKNVIHFAAWVPIAPLSITYSTVEPRSNAPGWQANNDLYLLSFTANGTVFKPEKIIESNSGGIYGWWGTNFSWSPDGAQLAYARPDSIGLVDFQKKQLISFINLLPFQTRSDWAWVPGLGWAQDHSALFIVTHVPKTGSPNDETSPFFDLSAFIPSSGTSVGVISQSGMFAYPVPSPLTSSKRYWIAYLQAVFPERSDTCRYRLIVMDRDGSNRKIVFPPEGSPGLEPHKVVWAPAFDPEKSPWLAFIHQGNLWLLMDEKGTAQQITGDNSITKIDWKE